MVADGVYQRDDCADQRTTAVTAALGCGNDTCDVEGSFAMGAQDRREAQRLQPFSSAQEAVCALVSYAVDKALIGEEDRTFAANALLDVLRLEPDADFDPMSGAAWESLEATLAYLLNDAVARGVCDAGIASRDLLDTRLMGCLTPRPHEVIATFWHNFDSSPEAATDYLYRLSQDSDYIRTYRVAKDLKWVTPTRYGNLDITINLSKPEKDPRAIAAALKVGKAEQYPRCLLCPENEGYAGRLDHPARQTIRLIPLTLADEPWFLQYSPYVYYNEHCIVLSRTHMPMHISRKTFRRLLDFVALFPHYTLGSNADLPIVGGSILSHEHFQGGRYEFAMQRAGVRQTVDFVGFPDIQAQILDWPLTVIRLDADDPARLVDLADRILTCWRTYSDEHVGVFAATGETPHNTITPIARRRGAAFELDLVLRNNRTSDEHPLGIFHPHAELHHIKRENIGLIEVMGLAVLPARLKDEMTRVCEVILAGEDVNSIPEVAHHGPWVDELLARRDELAPEALISAGVQAQDRVNDVLKEEVGQVFARVLEDCGVFKEGETGAAALDAFVRAVNQV